MFERLLWTIQMPLPKGMDWEKLQYYHLIVVNFPMNRNADMSF